MSVLRWSNVLVVVGVVGALAEIVAMAGCPDNNNGIKIPQGAICVDSCPKDCGKDQDCNTADGELCCDFGIGNPACVKAAQCPRFCSGDAQCDTSKGQACLRSTLYTSNTSCIQPTQAIKFCGGASDCKASEVCCDIYAQPLCLPADHCPKTCGTSSDCNTTSGETCCTTLSSVDLALSAHGLCINTNTVPCPTTCQTSSQCNTGNGELCCNGVCSTSCPKSCDKSADCTGQICCKSSALTFSSAGGRPVGYPVTTSVPSAYPCCYGSSYYDCSSTSTQSACLAGSTGSCTRNASKDSTCGSVVVGTETCAQIVTCWESCSSTACVSTCKSAGTALAQSYFTALYSCVQSQCPTSTTIDTCVATSVQSGGPCESYYSTCAAN